MRKRFRPKKENILKGTGYDSMFEKNMHEGSLKECSFHNKDDKVAYIVEHTYEPDFVFVKDGKKFLIETKGRFSDSAEASKYVWVRKVLPEDTELVFVWEKFGTAFPFSRKRKDGTRMTHKEWADKNEFRNWSQTQFNLDLL